MLHSVFEEVTLYYLGGNNAIYEWHICVENDTLVINHGRSNGVKTTTYEVIDRGKGGRSLFGQIQSRLNSRIHTQRLRGYKDTIEEARLGRTNVLDLPKPMLAQSWNKVKNLNIEDMYVQWKYDGNRCLITRQGDKLVAYSRKGKVIKSIGHILNGMDLPEGLVIDGELYHHGTPLPTIRSWISRNQPDTSKLSFHAYDVVLPIDYKYRLRMLEQLSLGKATEVAPTLKMENLQLSEMMNRSRQLGYEGLILRNEKGGYDIGKRSKNLIKVKVFLDEEFEVNQMYLSEKGMPMATCLIDDGRSFDVVLPGTKEEKRRQLENKYDYLGRHLTIEFSQWTPDGLPFHAVAKCWSD